MLCGDVIVDVIVVKSSGFGLRFRRCWHDRTPYTATTDIFGTTRVPETFNLQSIRPIQQHRPWLRKASTIISSKA
jgi:hypothetical protein